jgi:hypothetical protein
MVRESVRAIDVSILQRAQIGHSSDPASSSIRTGTGCLCQAAGA